MRELQTSLSREISQRQSAEEELHDQVVTLQGEVQAERDEAEALHRQLTQTNEQTTTLSQRVNQLETDLKLKVSSLIIPQ